MALSGAESIDTNPFELSHGFRVAARRLRRSNTGASAAERMERDTLKTITTADRMVDAGILEYIRLAPLEHVTINILHVCAPGKYYFVRYTPLEGDIDMGDSQVTLLLEGRHFTRLTITTGVAHMISAFANAAVPEEMPIHMLTKKQGAGRETTPLPAATAASNP